MWTNNEFTSLGSDRLCCQSRVLASMGTSQSSRGTVRFGVFEVDVQSAELHKQGTKVKLQEQPFQILQTLLEHPGEVVTREELQKRIWPADTFVDFEQGLYNAIKKLREALGDSAENPRFIETLPRRGYRFLASVTVPSQSQVKPNEPVRPGGGAVATVATPRLWMRVMRFAVLGLAGIVLGATFRIQWV